MPMGVPVVRPSNTPERMRTSSPSRRWLTKWEVPVRRRSMSGCRSASPSGSPGGQPSTIQPRAGPWLSPKVVTEKSLPIVLPDKAVYPNARLVWLARAQLFRRQQENAPATALEIEPNEWEAAKRATYRRLGVPHLNNEQTTRAQMPSRFPQNDAYGVEAVAARGECDARLVAILGRQPLELALPHVGRVCHNDIVGLPPERAEVVRLQNAHTPLQLVAPHIDARNFQRVVRNIDRVDPSARESHCTGDRNASRACPQI